MESIQKKRYNTMCFYLIAATLFLFVPEYVKYGTVPLTTKNVLTLGIVVVMAVVIFLQFIKEKSGKKLNYKFLELKLSLMFVVMVVLTSPFISKDRTLMSWIILSLFVLVVMIYWYIKNGRRH